MYTSKRRKYSRRRGKKSRRPRTNHKLSRKRIRRKSYKKKSKRRVSKKKQRGGDDEMSSFNPKSVDELSKARKKSDSDEKVMQELRDKRHREVLGSANLKALFLGAKMGGVDEKKLEKIRSMDIKKQEEEVIKLILEHGKRTP